MNVHEFQAKEVLKKYGVAIPDFVVISSYEEAKEAVERLSLDSAVVKVQVHAGGRGKAGGVKFAKTREEILTLVDQMLGMKLVNEQTGSSGIIAKQLMITEPTEIKKEYYVGAVIDRERGYPTLILSPEGGMDIEEVAEKSPEKILTVPISLDGRVKRFHLINIAKFMGWEGTTAKEGMACVAALAKAFIESDGALLEINPLVEDQEGKIWAIDAKLALDDNAMFRQQDLAKYYDPSQESSQEVRAHELDLAYIALEGNIGCLVNGAGLAMATMDIIHYYGGKPANFLDVGGSASDEKVKEAFKIILEDQSVKGILVNIFGGIMNCATIAQGIIKAVNELSIAVPLVVRLEGTNVEEGKRLLTESKLNIISADSLGDAAKKVVAAIA